MFPSKVISFILSCESISGFDMNPEAVKRREYIGIACFLGGVFLCIVGIAGFFLHWTAALTIVIFGIATGGGGIATLSSIPDLIHTPDESW